MVMTKQASREALNPAQAVIMAHFNRDTLPDSMALREQIQNALYKMAHLQRLKRCQRRCKRDGARALQLILTQVEPLKR